VRGIPCDLAESLMMPKPELVPLTGGYRKTRVMKIGADIYRDTRCIQLALRFPQ
jgi:hypothetical protein